MPLWLQIVFPAQIFRNLCHFVETRRVERFERSVKHTGVAVFDQFFVKAAEALAAPRKIEDQDGLSGEAGFGDHVGGIRGWMGEVVG